MTEFLRSAFSEAEIEAFSPAEKIGLVATVNPEGLPHITLITSIMACGPKQITLGEFSRGKSKEYLQANSRMAFLIMTADRKMWRGRARWTHFKKEGPEYEMYNNLPMFRYNAYFGINTVHYLDLLAVGNPERLPLGAIMAGALLASRLQKKFESGRSEPILKPFAEKKLFNSLTSLKSLAWIDTDGFPVLFPVCQCRAADSGRLVLVAFPYRRHLEKIPDGATVAVFGVTMATESVLVRGRLSRQKTGFGPKALIIDIDWVYNSMPPCHGQIYPAGDLNPVKNFT